MPRFFAGVDFDQHQSKNFVAEGSSTPPSVGTEKTGQLWNDTSLANNAVLKYWDGNEWVRMDGGGDIPNGMILDRHIAANAAIQWSKIAAPTGGAALVSQDQLNSAVTAGTSGLNDRVTTLEGGDAGQSARQIAVSAIANAGLNGSFVDLTTAQTVAGIKTFSASPVVPVATTATQAVQLSQLTAEVTRATAAEGTNAAAITSETSRATAAEDALRTDLTSATGAASTLAGRVTTAEGLITGLRTDVNTNTSGLAAEVTRATAAESALGTAFAAADTAIGNRITDEIAARTQGDTAVTALVTAETTRAEAAEGALDGRVDTLEGRDATVDGRITTAANAERDRALAAEGLLNGRIGTLEGVDNFTQAEFTTFNTANTAALAGKADLDSNGKLRLSQVPSLTVTSTTVVADTAARDALDAQEGDVAVVTGVGTFIKDSTGAWIELSAPAGGASASDLSSEAATRAAADTALANRLATLEGTDYETQVEADAEHALRVAAEAALQTAINTEHSHHVAGDAALQTALDTEAATRLANDNTNAAAVAAEVTRAEAAEADLSSRITTEVADRGTADTQIRTDFAAADLANSNALAAEVSRATGAEGTLTTNLGAEVTRATGAESALGGRIDTVVTSVTAEATRAGGIEAGLRTDITALQNAGATAGTDLSALTTRVSATESKNTEQDGRLTSLEGADTAIRGEFAAADLTEKNARIAGDAANATAVSDEAGARASADTALGGRIDTEASNRNTADLALGVRIDSANTALTDGLTTIRGEFAAADTAVRGDFAAADNVVRGEFAAADATLQSAINTKAADADVVHKAGAETISGVKTFSVSPQVPTGAAGNDAVNFAQLTAATNSGGTALADEIARATAAEAAITSANATEKTRVNAALALKADLIDGKVPTSQLPALALTNVSTVADIAARDALANPDMGDVAVVGDNGQGVRATYIYNGTAWIPMSSPADVTEAELAAAVAAGLATVTSRIDGLGAGAGLTRTGDTFDVVGTANRVTVNADSIDIASTYVGQASITTVGTITSGTWNGAVVDLAHGGTGYAATSLDDFVDHLHIAAPSLSMYAETLTAMVSGTPFTVTHNLGGEDVVTQLRQINGSRAGEVVFADVKVTGVNTITVTVDPSHDEAIDLRVTVIGGPVGSDGSGLVNGSKALRRFTPGN